MRNIQKLAYTLDTSLRSKASVGFVALATDHVLEHEVGRSVFYNHFPGVGCYTTRIQNDVTISQKTLANMEQQLSGAVQSLLPGKGMVEFAQNSFSGFKMAVFSFDHRHGVQCDCLRLYLSLPDNRARKNSRYMSEI